MVECNGATVCPFRLCIALMQQVVHLASGRKVTARNKTEQRAEGIRTESHQTMHALDHHNGVSSLLLTRPVKGRFGPTFADLLSLVNIARVISAGALLKINVAALRHRLPDSWRVVL